MFRNALISTVLTALAATAALAQDPPPRVPAPNTPKSKGLLGIPLPGHSEPADFSGQWKCAGNGTAILTQSGNTISGTMTGTTSEWWGPSRNKGGVLSGTIDGETATLEARDGAGNVTEWVIKLSSGGKGFEGKFKVVQGPLKGAGGNFSGSRGNSAGARVDAIAAAKNAANDAQKIAKTPIQTIVTEIKWQKIDPVTKNRIPGQFKTTKGTTYIYADGEYRCVDTVSSAPHDDWIMVDFTVTAK